MFQEHVKKSLLHGNFLSVSWKHSCAEMKRWGAERTVWGTGNKIVIFLWSSSPVTFDETFVCVCVCVYTHTPFFAIVAVRQVLVVIRGIQSGSFLRHLISVQLRHHELLQLLQHLFCSRGAQAVRTVTPLKASYVEVG